LCDATTTNEDGYYKITNFNINEGELCEIDALYTNDDGTTEEGSFTFIYHRSEVTDLGLITIYPASIGLNSLHVNWDINCDPNTVDRIWPVIQDATTGDIFYKTARWGDDYTFKLPAGTYNVWIEYIDLSDIPQITEEQMKRAILRVDGTPVPKSKVLFYHRHTGDGVHEYCFFDFLRRTIR